MAAQLNLQSQTVRFWLFILIILICISLGQFFHIDFEQYKAFLLKFPLWLSGLIFVVLYVVLTILVWVGPNDFFRITGAAIFGPYISTVFIYVAEMIQAIIFFHLSRKLGRGFVEEKFRKKEKDLEMVKSHSGYLGIFALRINPFIPYRFLDLAYGLTKVPFRKYFTVALLASAPRILWLQFILAGIGLSIIKDPKALLQTMLDYLLTNYNALLFSELYLLFVAVVSLLAVVAKVLGKRKKRIK